MNEPKQLHITVNHDAGLAEVSRENRSYVSTELVNLNTGISVLLPIKRKTDDEQKRDGEEGRFSSF